jgi:flagellar biogenesis protein FliO
MTEAYIQMIVALAVVVGLVAVFGLYMRKKQVSSPVMQVVAYQSLGPRKGIAVVKVGKEAVLLAVTSADVKLLKGLNAADFEDEASSEIREKLEKLRSIKGRLHEPQ